MVKKRKRKKKEGGTEDEKKKEVENGKDWDKHSFISRVEGSH